MQRVIIRTLLAKAKLPGNFPSILQVSAPKFQPQHQQKLVYFSTESRTCWRCNSPTGPPSSSSIFCGSCGAISEPPQAVDHFELFGLDQSYRVDTANLAKVYKQFQRQIHPDKFGLKSQDEKEISEQWSPLVNRAYATLVRPLSRALYMLEIFGKPLEEGDIDVDPEFLMEIMELNEDVAMAKEAKEVKELGDAVREKLIDYSNLVEQCFNNGDIENARIHIAHMKYYDNIMDKIVKLESDLGMIN